MALVTSVGVAAVVNAFADRFTTWLHRRGGPGPSARKSGHGSPTPSPPPPPTSPRVRLEHFGSILAWPSPPAMLFLDHDATATALAAGAVLVGSDDPPPAGALSAPLEAHVAVTARCPVACEGCYLEAGPDRSSPDPTHDELRIRLREMAERGVLEVAFGGGEAGLRDDLIELGREVRELGMVPNLTTSGFGLTRARADAMAGVFGQVNVSIDGLGDSYTRVRGWDGARLALRAIDRLVHAGVRVGANTVLTRHNLATLPELGRALADHGVSEWQWIRFKPTGRGVATYADLALDEASAHSLWPTLLQLEQRTGLTLRIDCALVPFLADHHVPPAHLEQLAISGCRGGESLISLGPDGRWSPCSFAHALPGTDASLARTWQHDPTLRAWRDRAQAPPEPCASCAWASTCRGGCRIVAAHLTGDALAPDPECPRVRRWREVTS